MLRTVVMLGLSAGRRAWDCRLDSSACVRAFVETAKDVDGMVPTPTATGGNGSNKYVSSNNSSVKQKADVP